MGWRKRKGSAGSFQSTELHDWVLESGKWQEGVQAYLASISFADAQIGRLLDALYASSHSGNTVIVLWSDHGWHLGEKQHWHKRTLWDESTRIPLILVAPGTGEAGQRCMAPASLVDIFPTLTDLCRLPRPLNQKLDGISLVPWLEDPNRPRRQAAITVDENQHLSARGQRYRYIRYNDGSEEFYDHQTDPDEWTNRIADPGLRPDISSLAAQLPATLAPQARTWTSFDFNPDTYSWIDKDTGVVIQGR